MTDTATISDATIAEIGKLAPEAKTNAREQLARHYSPAEIERAFGTTVKPQGNSGQEPGPAPRAINVADDALDIGQTIKGLAALYKHGSPDMQARVLQQAKARGIAPEEVTGGNPVAPEVLTRDEQLQKVPATFTDPNGPPVDASAYRLQYDPATVADISADALAALDGDMRESFRAAEVPVSHAQAILDAITAATALYPEGQSDADKQLTQREQGAILRRTYGEAEAERIVADASALYFKMPEAFRKMVDERSGFTSAAAQVALAQAYRARRKS